MQVHQIVIRSPDDTVTVIYADSLGSRYKMVLDAATLPSVAALVSECQARLPADSENPAKGAIQQEITELENRITKLKETIGQA